MYTQNRKRLTDTKQLVITKGRREEKRKIGYGIKRYKVLGIKQMSHKDTL